MKPHHPTDHDLSAFLAEQDQAVSALAAELEAGTDLAALARDLDAAANLDALIEATQVDTAALLRQLQPDDLGELARAREGGRR